MLSFKHKIPEGFCSEVAKRARRALALTLPFSIFAITTLYAQSSGTPSQLRVKTDANGYLVAAIGAQTNPLTQSTFSQTRLKTDANGYLIVAIGSGSGIIPVANGGTGRSSLTIHNVLVGNGTSAVTLVPGCTNGALFWTASSVDPTCNTSPTFTNLTNTGVHFLADGTISNPALAFTNNTAIGIYRGTDTLFSIVGSNRFTSNFIHWGEATYNNGQSGLAGANSLLAQDYVRFFPNDWGAHNGFVIEARSTTSTTPSNPTLELQARAYNASTWAVIQFDAFKVTGSAGTYSLQALSDTDFFLAYCNNSGSTPCDNKLFSMLGNGQSTLRVISVASSALGAVSQYGYSLTNDVAATNGAQAQWSPALQLCGTAWKTDATTGSQIDCWRVIDKPIAAAGVTTATLAFQSSINDGINTFTDRFTVTSAGLVTGSTFNSTSSTYSSAGTAVISGTTHLSSGSGMAVANVGANSCGTSTATIAGNNNLFTITVGATAGTQCRVAFTVTATNEWGCTANDDTTTVAVRTTPVDTTHVDLIGTFTAGDKVTGICFPR